MTALFSIVLIAVCALALMALEAFIPGVSIAGIAGVVLIGFAAYLCFNAYGATAAVILLVAAAFLSFLIMRFIFRSMKSGRLSKSGVFMSDSVQPAIKTIGFEQELMPGAIGISKTALRPSGIAEFDGRRVHVVSGNGFIEKDARVAVVRTEGARILVKPLDQ